MPLKIRVKPEGKLFINGAVVKNVGSRLCDLLVLEGRVLREEFIEHAKELEARARQIYTRDFMTILVGDLETSWDRDREDVRQRYRKMAQAEWKQIAMTRKTSSTKAIS